MKKWSIYLICLALLLMLTACGGREDTESGVPTENAGYQLGVGTVSSMDLMGEDMTSVKATFAAVLLDKDGVIRQCRLDETAFDVTLKNGMLQDILDMTSKWEMGDKYTLTDEEKGDTQTTRSWKEQVQAFCRHVVGMTPDEVSAIAATDGRSNEIEGCDLVITDFIQAVHKAGKAAKKQSSSGGDTLRLAVTAEKSGEATNDTPQYDIEIAAMSLNKNGKITGCYTDTLSTKMSVKEGAFSVVSGDVATKRQMGDSYGMKEASSIKKEWYQQADAFDAYAVGKTADQLRGLKPNSEGKVDGISGCTIKVTGMLKNAIKAAEDTDDSEAGSTGGKTTGNTQNGGVAGGSTGEMNDSGAGNGSTGNHSGSTGGAENKTTGSSNGKAADRGTDKTDSSAPILDEVRNSVSDTVSDITGDISDMLN